jgi:hypothetical protein
MHPSSRPANCMRSQQGGAQLYLVWTPATAQLRHLNLAGRVGRAGNPTGLAQRLS